MRNNFLTLASLASLAAAGPHWKSWYLDHVELDSVIQRGNSRYRLDIKYGPNDMWIFGRYAYMYFELSGDEIADNAVVAMNAHILNVDYWLRGADANGV